MSDAKAIEAVPGFWLSLREAVMGTRQLHQLEICFVEQSGGLQRMAAPLHLHVPMGNQS
jgi:hypothetical protein